MKPKKLSEELEKEREMGLTQLHFIKYAAEEVIECLESCGMEIPEWYQNKITEVHYEMKDIHSYMEGKKSKMMDKKMKSRMDYLAPNFSRYTIEELEKDEDDPCWDGYVQVGTKMKDGKEVPNCVPMKKS